MISLDNILYIIIFAAFLLGTYFGLKKIRLFDQRKSHHPSDDDDEPVFSSDEDEDEEEHVEEREFRLSELKEYNGEDEDKIYVSVKGAVFDVTGSAFYSHNSQYHKFSGHDASFNIAKASMDTSNLDKMDLSSLSDSEKRTLDETLEFYENKFVKVGWLKEYVDAHPKSLHEKKNE